MKIDFIRDDNGYEVTTTARITYADGSVSEFNDRIQPEDISFDRDLYPFILELTYAYQKGMEVGFKEASKQQGHEAFHCGNCGDDIPKGECPVCNGSG